MAAKPRRRMSAPDLKNVQIQDRFWAPRIGTNCRITVPYEYEQCKQTGRIDAFKLDWKPGEPNPPHIFWDSDVAKWVEAAAYCLADQHNARLEKLADQVIDLIASAQQPDGYLNVHFTVVEPEKRWTNLRDWHELYCAGHLIEAAVAYYEVTGKRKLLDTMCRYADHIDSVFGRGEARKRGYPGHEEIELALVKLYRTTGQQRYLDLAKFFVDERGQEPNYFRVEAEKRNEAPERVNRSLDYTQAHRPVRDQETAEGHAVRAMYLYCGMTDVAAETGDRELMKACERLWKNVTQRRMYITGGIGSTAHGERFTTDYDLPNETAYAETCAAIGLVFWAHRMLEATADSRYGDVMERALYNGTISGVSLDGERFFYVNPLIMHPPTCPAQASRQEWFSCSCCPPNIARLLAQFGRYVYSQSPESAFVHLFVQGQGDLTVGSQTVRISQKTRYPWKEDVQIGIEPEEEAQFTLAVRIPGWCRNPQLTVNGKKLALHDIVKGGYAHITRTWTKGDRLKLELPMPVERIEANPNVRMNAGRVALQRGPVVYCLEEVDNGPNLADVTLPVDPEFKVRFEKDLLGGVIAITAKAARRPVTGWNDTLYRPMASRTRSTRVKAVPYCVWNNRGEGEMIVWIRQAQM